MNWYRKLILRNFKKRVLVEIATDIKFIKKHRYAELHYDEQKARNLLVEEKKKEEKADEQKINRISREIAETQAVKKEYEDLNRLLKDTKLYIGLI